MSAEQIKVYRGLLDSSEEIAESTRRLLAEKNVVMLNIIGSPGCGKTTLLEKTVGLLKDRIRFAILEGDVETTHDAERLNALNVLVRQLITDGGCHLSPKMVHTAVKDLDLDALDVVLVENVGNLVCPANFDIGETAKVAVLSVTEGEDKPVKYPLLFKDARAVVLTKIDLLPHLTFDLDACLAYIRRVNAEAPIFQTSAATGEGVQAWADFVVNSRSVGPV